MADIFGKDSVDTVQPLTADKCTLYIDSDPVATALQVNIEYAQQVTRRRSIGNKVAVIYGSQPQGRATVARMLIDGDPSVGKTDIWKQCAGGTLAFKVAGNCDAAGKTYQCFGCIVTSYSVTAQAEDLSVVDNVVIEFLSLEVS